MVNGLKVAWQVKRQETLQQVLVLRFCCSYVLPETWENGIEKNALYVLEAGRMVNGSGELAFLFLGHPASP